MTPFHYAFKVKDLNTTRNFYCNILGCKEGRSTATWIDFDFFGHQLSAHISNDIKELDYCGLVDGIAVPIPHFGCVLSGTDFEKVKNKLILHHIEFIVKPQLRYSGKAEAQNTMFVLDFSGNPIEFKCLVDKRALFKQTT